MCLACHHRRVITVHKLAAQTGEDEFSECVSHVGLLRMLSELIPTQQRHYS